MAEYRAKPHPEGWLKIQRRAGWWPFWEWIESASTPDIARQIIEKHQEFDAWEARVEGAGLAQG